MLGAYNEHVTKFTLAFDPDPVECMRGFSKLH
jgi:hypothetical protein